MSFFTVNIKDIHRSSLTFFIITIVGWGLILLPTLFGTEVMSWLGTNIPGGILVLIYAAAYVSPFIAAIYSWFLVFHPEAKDYRIFGWVSAVSTTMLSLFIIYIMISQ